MTSNWAKAAAATVAREPNNVIKSLERDIAQAMTDTVEAVARAIFEHWQFKAHVPWVAGGNSTKQSEARDYAQAAISALQSLGWRSAAEVEAIAQAAGAEMKERAAKEADTKAAEYEGEQEQDWQCSKPIAVRLRGLAEGIRALKPDAGLWQRVPDDCVVVPREPTEAMLNAELGLRTWDGLPSYESRRDLRPAIYRAMLAAGGK